MLFIVCAKDRIVNNALNALRLEYGLRFGYTDESRHEFAWITDFPLLEYNDEEKRFFAAHHPFTRPNPDDLETFLTKKIRRAWPRCEPSPTTLF